MKKTMNPAKLSLDKKVIVVLHAGKAQEVRGGNATVVDRTIINDTNGDTTIVSNDYKDSISR